MHTPLARQPDTLTPLSRTLPSQRVKDQSPSAREDVLQGII